MWGGSPLYSFSECWDMTQSAGKSSSKLFLEWFMAKEKSTREWIFFNTVFRFPHRNNLLQWCYKKQCLCSQKGVGSLKIANSACLAFRLVSIALDILTDSDCLAVSHLRPCALKWVAPKIVKKFVLSPLVWYRVASMAILCTPNHSWSAQSRSVFTSVCMLSSDTHCFV